MSGNVINEPNYPGETIAITASDSTDYVNNGYNNGIYVYTTAQGTVSVEDMRSNTRTFTNYPAYQTIPFRCRKVKAATNVTCIGIVPK